MADETEDIRRQVAAAERMLRLKKARGDMLEFTKLTMPDPASPDDINASKYEPAKHHEVIAAALEEVEAGRMLRLIITMPPRHGKSELASKRFPAWFIGKDPSREVILATYNANFAQDFGRKVRDILEMKVFQQIFPGSTLKNKAKAADRLEMDENGLAHFVGTGGSLTGRGADCVTGDTLVDTERGPLKIKELARMQNPPLVKSLNTKTNEIEYRSIVASVTRRASETFKITTSSGRVVQATGNHPFICSGRFVEGASLATGDDLMLLVPEADGVQLKTSKGERSQGAEKVLLLQGTCNGSSPCGGSVEGKAGGLPKEGSRLSDMQQHLHVEVARKEIREVRHLLREKMCGDWAFKTNVRKKKSEMETRRETFEAAAAFGSGVQTDEAGNIEAGRVEVRHLRGRQGSKARGASYRQLADEQLRLKSSDIVQPASSKTARGLGFKTIKDTVSSVERVREETLVYDIEVEGNHTFFANGIACLNCLIIDDAIKSRVDANSKSFRDKQWEWFTQVAMTRLLPMGRVVIIMTRWHEDDLVGRLTDPSNPCYNRDEAASWKVLSLPAIAEDDDPMKRTKGEALWPERYPIPVLEAQRRLDPTGFSALYQGKPTPDDGDYFTREMLVGYRPGEMPDNLRWYAASDHAVATTQEADKTCMGCVGVDEDGDVWIPPDIFWRRARTDVVVDGMLDQMQRHSPIWWWAERGHISKAIGPFLRKRMQERNIYCAIDEVVPAKDKQTRAQAIRGRMAMGKVHFPKFASWWGDAEAELLKFPAARHDDFVDWLAHIGMGLSKTVSASVENIKDEGPKVGTLAWIKKSSQSLLDRENRLKSFWS